jgi:hypothetical protein
VRRESLLVLGLFVAFSALVGLVFGVATGGLFKAGPPDPTPGVRPTRTAVQDLSATATPGAFTVVPTLTVPASQMALLLIGVDDLDAAAPRLEGVWIITFLPGTPGYYAICIPPGAQFEIASLDGPQTLDAIFAEDQRLQRGFEFVRDAVRNSMPGVVPGAELLVDRQTLVGLVKAIGGIPLAGELAEGHALLASYDALPPQDEAARLAYQAGVFALLYDAMAEKHWTPADLAAYLGQLPHVHGSPQQSGALEALAAAAPPFDESDLVWQHYQPPIGPP